MMEDISTAFLQSDKCGKGAVDGDEPHDGQVSQSTEFHIRRADPGSTSKRRAVENRGAETEGASGSNLRLAGREQTRVPGTDAVCIHGNCRCRVSADTAQRQYLYWTLTQSLPDDQVPEPCCENVCME